MARLDLSPELYRQLAYRAADLTADYLEDLPALPTFPVVDGEICLNSFRHDLPEVGLGEAAFDDLKSVLAQSRPPSPRFFGYVLGSGDPISAIADLVASVLNQNVTAWRSSPAAVTIEQTVVSWLAEFIGCAGYKGSLTGGGSSANLMGLAMAREAKAPANEDGAQPGTIYASTEVHMSIPKAAALLGLGHHAVRPIGVDENFRIRTGELRAAIEADRAAGKRGIAIVANGGTVNTGAIDPLEELARIARKYNLWFHIDGAYGVLAAGAVPEKFRGVAEADSLSLDPHKWLYQPLDCGCLLYKDQGAAQQSFAHSGDYARSLSNDPVEGFAFFEESMELSRRFRALKLWLSLRYHGAAAFRGAIAEDIRLAQHLAKKIAEHEQLQLLAPVELSAVCFRYCPKGMSEERANSVNAKILKQVQRGGTVFFSNATLNGKFALRACIVNHRSTERDVEAVVHETLRIAGTLR